MELNLRGIRKSRNLTQEELADKVSATKRQIGAWERGENDMPMDYAAAIADALGCSIDEIAGHVKPESASGCKSADEAELLRLYRFMDAIGREHLLENAAFLAERHPLNKANIA
ncbi:MAG: helix-turn-helix transcriptional regulator [Eggerthellaceae bacterium]|nr:helix-turn-helix transcriptional regulator [Eggerthellaceae bacterium]